MNIAQMNMERKVVLIAIILIILLVVFKFVKKKFKSRFIQKVSDEVLEWVNTGLSALFFAFLIMYFILQAFKIPSGSMMNTFLIKDQLFVNKFIYGFRLPIPESLFKVNMKRVFSFKDPERFEIIIFTFPEDRSKDFIKRCVGIPGDKIEIKDKVLYVNDEMIDESYVIHADERIYTKNSNLPDSYIKRDNYGPVTVPEEHYFVLGDNRDNSYDSRFWGLLHSDFIKGRPLIIYWPPKRIKLVK